MLDQKVPSQSINEAEPDPVSPEYLAFLPPKPKRKRRFWLIIFILTLALLALSASAFFTFQNTKSKAESGLAHFQSALRQLKGANNSSFNSSFVKWLGEELNAAENDFKQARQNISFWGGALPLAENLPGPGYDLAKLPDFLAMAEKASHLSRVALEGVRPALPYFENGNNEASSSAKLLLAAQALSLPEAKASFQAASELLEELAETRAKIDSRRLNLSQTRDGLKLFDEQLPTLQQGLVLARQLPPILPAALGKDKPLTYLALIQNSDELRPGGGFVSAIGLITITKGKISLAGFQDSYTIDNPNVPAEIPPDALAQYMQAGKFLLRDANWWPDFPTSARKIADLYRQHQGREVDGVIALDSKAVSYIFQALGPLELPTYQERLTAGNFEERLRAYYLPPGTTQNGDWWLKRKEFIGVVMQSLFGKLNAASARDYLELATQLSQAVAEKHLQFYFNRPELESQLTRLGLDGAQISGQDSSDYLMLVETNVGFNKVNPNIERSVSYSVAGAGSGANLFASLTLTYTNRAGVREGTPAGECTKVAKYDSSYASMMNGCYWNYLRVYVPQGAILRQAENFTLNNYPLTLSENGKTIFASQLVIPPGQTLTFTFDYILPSRLLDNKDYKLSVQKQAGLPAYSFNIEAKITNLSQNWLFSLDKDSNFQLNGLVGFSSKKS